MTKKTSHTTGTSTPGQRPNVLLLFTDQQRFDTIAAGGFPHMLTPNLDRLVREGCHFTNAYSPNPVCVPARHNVLTGLPARYHGFAANFSCYNRYCGLAGIPLPLAALPTLPRILSDHGYHTRAIGKMHFQPTRRHNGFDKMELMEEGPRFREDDEYAMYLKNVGLGHILNIHGVRNLLYMAPQRSLIPEEHHGSTWVGKRASAFLRAEAGRRPFFLWASWISPHPPFDVPDTFAGLYQDRNLPAPSRSATPCWPEVTWSKVNARFPPDKEDQYVRRMRELYYAAISLVDKNVGKVLDALDEIGETDNTLIIFTSDHGEMLGDHGAYQKMLPYDSCARIPFIARYPRRFQPGSVRNDFVDLNDILPTVLDVCGLKYPGPYELPGGSICGNQKDRSHQYIEYHKENRRWIAMLDERYKYGYHYGGGRELLFDRQAHPDESINLLATRPDGPEVRAAHARLRARLCAYEEKWGLEDYARAGQFRHYDQFDYSALAKCNNQFPHFQENIADPEEKKAMNDFSVELLNAAAPERDVMQLHEMALDDWVGGGGPPDLAQKIRAEKL